MYSKFSTVSNILHLNLTVTLKMPAETPLGLCVHCSVHVMYIRL